MTEGDPKQIDDASLDQVSGGFIPIGKNPGSPPLGGPGSPDGPVVKGDDPGGPVKNPTPTPSPTPPGFPKPA